MPLNSHQVVGLIEVDQSVDCLYRLQLCRSSTRAEKIAFLAADLEELRRELHAELYELVEQRGV